MAPTDLSQPTVSKHLKVLERAGLVSRGREAQFRPVRLNATPLDEAVAWLGDYRRFFTESLDRLDTYVKELKRKEGRHASKRRIEASADRELVITRTYDAPARLLFQAWSKPEHLMKWFGPVGWPLTPVRGRLPQGRPMAHRHDGAERPAEHAVRRRRISRSCPTGRSSSTMPSRTIRRRR